MNLQLVANEWNSFVICELKAHSRFMGQYLCTPQYEKNNAYTIFIPNQIVNHTYQLYTLHVGICANTYTKPIRKMGIGFNTKTNLIFKNGYTNPTLIFTILL
jgi:hypothetical protein